MKNKNNCMIINKFTILAVVFLFLIIIGKLIYVACSPEVDGIDLSKFALSRTTAKKTILANRGTIYDELGEVLAQDVRSYTVIAYLSESRTTDPKHPKHVVDKQMTAEALSPLINMEVDDILKLLKKDKYQVELGPGGRNITELVKGQIEDLDLPGIDFIKSTKRDYPNGDFASYIIGYAKKNDNDIIVGELGIEGKYNKELSGKNGSITYQKDAYGYQIANTPSATEESSDGYDIYLTIDHNIELYLENAISEIENIGCEWTNITIADAKTGAIVASSSSPSYNPNILNIKNYNNPLTSYAYEPGSTMKIYSFMAAIEEGKYDGNAKYKSGFIEVDDYKIKDWNNKGWGSITYDVGFTYSSNVAAVNLAQKLGKSKLLEYYEKFGFGKATGIELSNEYTGKIDFYYASELASASYGQGITTTPVQNIQALTSLTNKGIILKPYIISKIVDPNTEKIIYEGTRTELGRAVSENTVNKMIDLMDETVNGTDPEVTGKRYKTDSVRLIGKTGTAQYIIKGKYSSGDNNNIKSFAGIFPKEDPKYIIYFSVKDFKSNNSAIGSIISKMVESISKYKNLNSLETDEDSSKIIKIDNYLNKDVKDVKETLKKKGANIIILGDGDIVTGQYPSASSNVLVNSKVFILTNKDSYKMPDVIGWSRSEFITFANLLKIPYTIDGYGNVNSVNVSAGDEIIKDTKFEVTLGGKDEEE